MTIWTKDALDKALVKPIPVKVGLCEQCFADRLAYEQEVLYLIDGQWLCLLDRQIKEKQ
jgi:hypothetical protein